MFLPFYHNYYKIRHLCFGNFYITWITHEIFLVIYTIGNNMSRKPNSLLTEFLDKSIPQPTLDWETVPPGMKPADAWEAYDEGVEGWGPIGENV